MKNTEPTPTSDAISCFACESGTLITELRDYKTFHPSLGDITIPDVPMLLCRDCNELLIGDEGNRRIDDYLDNALNSISPEEIQELLSKYGLTQKQASQITGLGEKNISRWASGRARPSESVSNLLRLLLTDEMAFERLRQKNFRSEPVRTYPAEIRQPDSIERDVLTSIDYAKLVELKVVKDTRRALERRSELCKFTRSPDLHQFKSRMEKAPEKMAAFKDTNQRCNALSAGLWIYTGEYFAAKVKTAPYDRDKLRASVKPLRELTQHPLESVATDIKRILSDAGVALVMVPIFKESALRGCTRLLTPNKALIIHGLKYRSLSQFWIILFHEIAHLLLHIHKPGDVFTDYEDQASDEKEQDADHWAYDTLASFDRELEFKSANSKPDLRDLRGYAKSIKVHPAIAAEILNKRAGREIIAYSYLRKEGLFPHLSEGTTAALVASNCS